MLLRYLSLPLCLAALLLFGRLPLAPADESDSTRKADEETLHHAGITPDGPTLLEFFHKRTLSPSDQEKLRDTIQRLGHPSYRTRCQAGADLVRAGRVGLAFLERALQDPDPEIARRASLCLARIQQGQETELIQAAARTLGHLKPATAAAALVDYLPFAGDAAIQESVQAALNEVAGGREKPAGALVRALEDHEALKRGAAAEALTRAGPASVHETTARLLHDADAGVRLQTALAFVESRDKRGVPVLVALLADLPEDRAWLAQETLVRLAGEDGPRLLLSGDQTAAKVRDAWAEWWRKKADATDLARLTGQPRQLGYTLLVLHGNGVNGSVVELGRDKKPRWQLSNLRYPMDAQVLGHDRILVAEYIDRQVTERNHKGDILWQKKVTMPIGCERLPGRKTLIVSRNQILEVDAQNKETVLYARPDFTIAGAKHLRGGEMYVATSTGELLRLDRKGKVLKTLHVGQVYYFGGIDATPGGRVLVPEYRNNRVAEYDGQGKLLREVKAEFPTSAAYLPNGHLLIASMLRQKVREVDREGKTVWEYESTGRVFRARRR